MGQRSRRGKLPRRGWNRGFALVLAAAWASLALASSASASSVLPKGFPYAVKADVLISQTWQIAYIDASTLNNVCQTQSSTVHQQWNFDGMWKRGFYPVTLPVADARQLGKAAAHIHVALPGFSPPITRIGKQEALYTVTGYGPSTAFGDGRASDCDHKPFGGHGDLVMANDQTLFRKPGSLFAAPEQVFYAGLGDFAYAKPASFTGSAAGQVDVGGMFNQIVGYLPPAQGKDSWNRLVVGLPVVFLKDLVRDRNIVINIGEQGEQHAPCSASTNFTDDTGSEKCTIYWHYSELRVLVAREKLLRTTRAYSK